MMSLIGQSSFTPSRLTAILREAGKLAPGDSVISVRFTKTRKCTLTVAHMEARLSTGEAMPLVLKFCESGQQSTRAEVDFYSMPAHAFSPGVLPHCYYAWYDAEEQQVWMLLEDLEPEFTPMTNHVLELPTSHVRLNVLDWLTSLQVSFWNREELSREAYWRKWRDEPTIQAWFDQRHKATEDALKSGRGQVCSEVLAWYDLLRSRTPSLLSQRLNSGQNLTMVHGDAHGGNFLISSHDDRDFRLIDWPNWRPGLVTDDLAYVVAAWPQREQQQALECARSFLFAHLATHGAHTYNEEQWNYDLSLSAAWVFVYSIGLIGECREAWTYELANRVAALVETCCLDTP